MQNSDLKPISKFLSFILRHDPGSIGLTPDAGGWIEIDALIAAASRGGHSLTRDLIEEVARANDKKRFTLSPDGARIRAAQGHSFPVDLGLAPITPPETLYHGTAERNLASIMVEGLKPGARQNVHLSADIETAIMVGQRHGKPRVLRVDCKAATTAGQVFYLADNGVWLTGPLAPEFLSEQGTDI